MTFIQKQFSDKDIEQYIVNSPEKAYTLGFLWGDGTIKKHKITTNSWSNIYYPNLEINKKDLDEIIKLFNVWGNWSLYVRQRPNRKKQGSITLFNPYFGWFLTENDYIIKSYTEPTKILSKIPENLKSYWWRGFIDADGCFYSNKCANQFSLAGQYDQTWKETVNLFISLNIEKYQIQQKIFKSKLNLISRGSIIRISNSQTIIELGKYIYSDNLNIGLKRKYNKYCFIRDRFNLKSDQTKIVCEFTENKSQGLPT